MRLEDLYKPEAIAPYLRSVRIEPNSVCHDEYPLERDMILNTLKERGYGNPDEEFAAMTESVKGAYPEMDEVYAKTLAFLLIAKVEEIGLGAPAQGMGGR